MTKLESVATVEDGHFEVSDGSKFPYKVAVLNKSGENLEHGTELFTAAQMRQARIEALEEAAAVCDQRAAHHSKFGDRNETGALESAAEAILALLDAPSSSEKERS